MIEIREDPDAFAARMVGELHTLLGSGTHQAFLDVVRIAALRTVGCGCSTNRLYGAEPVLPEDLTCPVHPVMWENGQPQLAATTQRLHQQFVQAGETTVEECAQWLAAGPVDEQREVVLSAPAGTVSLVSSAELVALRTALRTLQRHLEAAPQPERRRR